MKKSELLALKKEGNALTKKVINVILDQDINYQESFMKEVCQHGCISGVVGELIYYHDTTEFYQKYKKEIQQLLKELFFETGYNSPAELFGNKWDNDDPFAEDTQNQNLLAWFGFEQTCYNLLNQLEIEF